MSPPPPLGFRRWPQRSTPAQARQAYAETSANSGMRAWGPSTPQKNQEEKKRDSHRGSVPFSCGPPSIFLPKVSAPVHASAILVVLTHSGGKVLRHLDAVWALAIRALFGNSLPFPPAPDHINHPPLLCLPRSPPPASSLTTPTKAKKKTKKNLILKNMDRVIHHFEITGMIPPPMPSGSSVHSWSSRSPSPFALAAPADEPPLLLGSHAPTRVSPRQAHVGKPTHRGHRTGRCPAPDIDADDDDEDFEENRDNGDDSEGGEDLDFVDDHEPISAPRIFANAKTLEEEVLENEAIAQHYIDKARGLQPARCDATPLLGDDDDKHRPRAVPPTLVDILDHPLYMFSVLPNTELCFIRQILLYPGIGHAMQSTFMRTIGSGAVCVETTDLKLLFSTLKQYPHFVRNRMKPVKIDALDSWVHVVFTTSPVEHIGHWRRLARPISTLSKGDLVFVQDGAIALGVPRIHRIDTDQAEGRKHGEKRPPCTLGLPPSAIKLPSLPQRLFNPAEFQCQYPDRKLQSAKEPEEQHMFSWHQLLFCSDGLEDLSWKGDSSFFSVAEVTPSETDLNWFIAANDSNRVIKTKGLWLDISPYHVDRDRGRQHFIVPVADLALQALTVVRSLIPGDRVKVVNGQEARGMSARVLGIAPKGMVELQLVEGSKQPRQHWQTRSRTLDITRDGRDGMDPPRNFYVGDVVNVVGGPTKGSIGFIFSITVGGFVEFLPCDADRLKVVADKTTSDGRIKYHYMAQDVSFSVPTADIQFLHVDQWHPPASSNVPTTGDRLWSVELDDTDWQARREFLHRAVMLVNDKKFKGYCGIIVGYIQRNPAEKPQYLVQLEARLTQVAVKLEDMRDRDTKRPLRDDNPEEESFPQRQSAPPVPEDPVVEDAVWGTGGALIVPDIESFLTQSHVGEDNGVWLTRAEFVNKRIDVKIIGVKKSQFPKLINAKGIQYQAHTGYLVPLSEAVKENTLHTKGIKIRVVPMSHVAIIPADALKPLRETPSQKCIGEEKGRVMIIGPDVYGSVNHMGQYAETMPGQSDDPAVVQVRFVKSDSDAVSPRGLYALKCLCRALNQELQCGNIPTPATPFTDD
ncbi:hypothetical protein K438DRAFT_1786659 [Mycena galopus ATCC 62051]|nr:hypothetical protein K438DRAFT_1786659 [Mycena galopus ATCC 62051]